MNKIQALKFSIHLFDRFIDNPIESKLSCSHVDVSQWVGGCPCCQYDREQGTDNCKSCPMWKGWPNAEYQPNFGCMAETSAFLEWDLRRRKHHLEYDVSFFAAVLVEAFQYRLASTKVAEAQRDE